MRPEATATLPPPPACALCEQARPVYPMPVAGVVVGGASSDGTVYLPWQRHQGRVFARGTLTCVPCAGGLRDAV